MYNHLGNPPLPERRTNYPDRSQPPTLLSSSRRGPSELPRFSFFYPRSKGPVWGTSVILRVLLFRHVLQSVINRSKTSVNTDRTRKNFKCLDYKGQDSTLPSRVALRKTFYEIEEDHHWSLVSRVYDLTFSTSDLQ